MIGILAMACFITGVMTGWLLRAVSVAAQISCAQERMQRKVHYWQNEAIRARAAAERLLRQLAASTGRKPEPPDWPTPGTS